MSRQVLIDSAFSTVVCAPVLSEGQGLATQVPVAEPEGLKHASVMFCDNLVTIPKGELTDYVGSLSHGKMVAVNRALRIALDIG